MTRLARPCVLVHGGWCGGWHWDEVRVRLARAGRDCRYVESPCPHDAAHAMPAAVAGIVETLAMPA